MAAPEFERSVKAWGLTLFGSGAVIGSLMTSCMMGTPIPPEPEVVTEVKRETEEVEVPTPYIPEACMLAIERALELNDEAAQLTETSATLSALLGEANKAIAEGDMQTNNELIQQQLDLIDEASTWLVPLSRGDAEVQSFMETCEDETDG